MNIYITYLYVLHVNNNLKHDVLKHIFHIQIYLIISRSFITFLLPLTHKIRPNILIYIFIIRYRQYVNILGK